MAKLTIGDKEYENAKVSFEIGPVPEESEIYEARACGAISIPVELTEEVRVALLSNYPAAVIHEKEWLKKVRKP